MEKGEFRKKLQLQPYCAEPTIYMCMYVCACVYMYIYVYICICICLCVCVRVCMYKGVNGVPLKSVVGKLLATKISNQYNIRAKIGNCKNFTILKSLIGKFSLHYSLIGGVWGHCSLISKPH